MQLHRIGLARSGLLLLEAIDYPLMPTHPSLGTGRFGMFLDLGLGLGVFLGRHLARRKLNGGGHVRKGDLTVFLLASVLVCLLPPAVDATGEFLQSRQPAQFPHALLSLLANHLARRLVPGRADPSQHDQVVAVAGTQQLTDFVPIIRTDGQVVLRLLRWTGNIDRRGDELLVLVPEEQHLDAVVFIALQAAKPVVVRLAIHLRVAVSVDRAPVLADNGMPQSPADQSRLARTPGFYDDLGQPINEKLDVLLGLDHAILGKIVAGPYHRRSGMRMRRANDQLAEIEVRHTVLGMLSHLIDHSAAKHAQIADDEDHLVDHLAALAGLQRQGRGRDRRLDRPRYPKMMLTQQRGGLVGRDADGSCSHGERGTLVGRRNRGRLLHGSERRRSDIGK